MRILKRLRASQPFNRFATTLVRAVLGVASIQADFVIRHLHRVGTVKSTLPSGETMMLWSRGDDWVSNQLFWRGLAGYEPETIPVFLSLAATARVTIDVGAYVGLYTLLAALSNRDGRVHAFEPHPAIYERLLRNVVLNGAPNVETHQCAVGAFDGEGDFHHIADGLPSSSSLSLQFMEGQPDLRHSRVAVITLDRFLRDRDVRGVDLLKIDTESTEPDVLAGMPETLRRDRPSIICEVLPGPSGARRLEQILDPLGYRYYLLSREGPVRRQRIEGDPVRLNYLFTVRSADEVARLWRGGDAGQPERSMG